MKKKIQAKGILSNNSCKKHKMIMFIWTDTLQAFPVKQVLPKISIELKVNCTRFTKSVQFQTKDEQQNLTASNIVICIWENIHNYM